MTLSPQIQRRIPLLAPHMGLALSHWLSLPSALRLSKHGFTPWNSAMPGMPAARGMSGIPGMPGISGIPAGLGQAMASVLLPEALIKAVEREAQSRALQLVRGVHNYQHYIYARPAENAESVWQHGAARCLYYPATSAPQHGKAAPAVLFIPSLINRHYILDLSPERSLIRHLAAAGVACYVIDWGEPTAAMRDWDAARYITTVLQPLCQLLRSKGHASLIAAGYCMGGVLALGLAASAQTLVDRLILLATPWDFAAPDMGYPPLEKEDWAALDRMLCRSALVPAALVQSLFYLLKPWHFQQKMLQFGAMDPASEAAREFMALECWVNDGVPLTQALARECLIRWTGDNMLARGDWQVVGKAVLPAHIAHPSLVVLPTHDHIVPTGCAAPLGDTLPQRSILRPNLGHVGMIVGKSAPTQLWQPMLEWIHQHTV